PCRGWRQLNCRRRSFQRHLVGWLRLKMRNQMSYFVVTFEAYAASANGRRLNPRELSEWTAKGFSETSRDEGTFPDGVVAVLCGSMGNTGKTFPDSKTQEHLVEIKLV